jgi:cell division protein FtsL
LPYFLFTVIANKAESALFTGDNLQQQMHHLEEPIKDREQESSAIRREIQQLISRDGQLEIIYIITEARTRPGEIDGLPLFV